MAHNHPHRLYKPTRINTGSINQSHGPFQGVTASRYYLLPIRQIEAKCNSDFVGMGIAQQKSHQREWLMAFLCLVVKQPGITLLFFLVFQPHRSKHRVDVRVISRVATVISILDDTIPIYDKGSR